MSVSTYFKFFLITSFLLLGSSCSNIKPGPSSPTKAVLEDSRPEAKKMPGVPEEKPDLPSAQESAPDPVQSPRAQQQPPIYEIGKASFYADFFQSRKTANGERFNQKAMTAAHKHLPFGTKVKVINKQNKKSVIVTINDRGPFVKGRIIDLSKLAFSRIGNLRKGLLDVQIQIIDKNELCLGD